MRVWLHMLVLLAAMTALFGFTALAAISAASYTPFAIRFDKSKYRGPAYGLDASSGHFEVRWGERYRSNFRSPGTAIFLFPAPRRLFPPTPTPNLPSRFSRLGFHWWTTQPDEASSPSFWRIPYRVGAPAWFVMLVSVLSMILAVRQISRSADHLIAPSRVLEGHCKGCGYDLRATPHRCPECGRVAPNPAVADARVCG